MAATKISNKQLEIVDNPTFNNSVLIESGTGSGMREFSFKNADINPAFKGGMSFDGGYSGFQSGTNKGIQIFGYWQIVLAGNARNDTPYGIPLSDGLETDSCVIAVQMHAGNVGFEVKAAASATANVMQVINSVGTVLFAVKPNGTVSMPGTPEFADNAAAITGGLDAGDVYHTAGALKIVI